jgi:hypothetical protein
MRTSDSFLSKGPLSETLFRDFSTFRERLPYMLSMRPPIELRSNSVQGLFKAIELRSNSVQGLFKAIELRSNSVQGLFKVMQLRCYLRSRSIQGYRTPFLRMFKAMFKLTKHGTQLLRT